MVAIIEFPDSSGMNDIDWTGAEVSLKNGKFFVLLRELFINEEYADGKGALMAQFLATLEFDIYKIEGKFVDDMKFPESQALYEELNNSIVCCSFLVTDNMDDQKYTVQCKNKML